MNGCALFEPPQIELYFYGELDAVERLRVERHLRSCAACRQALADLQAIRRVLAMRPSVDAPPAGDWSGFMRRLDGATRGLAQARATGVVLEHDGRRWSVRQVVALAAILALVTFGVVFAARFRAALPAPVAAERVPGQAEPPPAAANRDRSLRELSAEHLERSKLVILGLATRDPRDTRSADWQYERRLAATLLTDTRLYRMQAQDRGLGDVARVMRDLETVLIEASMSEESDRGALERVQRLITRRDLVVKMQVIAASSAGI